MTGRGNRGRARAGAAMLAALSLALAVPAVGAADEGSPSGACDPIDPAVCLQPWPNDYFTVPDASTPTGRRLNLDPLSMPRNRVGKPIDPTDMNRADGFSPGNPIITRVPGLDGPEAFRRTGAVPITDMARYADRDQPLVVIDAATGKRHPVWSEIDSTATSAANVNLIVRPAVNFREGHRYIVALRRLRRADGSIIPAPSGFRVYRDRLATDQPAVEARRPHMESLFARLADSKVARRDLYLAWDFTVASRQSLTDRMLAIRDAAFSELKDANLADLKADGDSPRFTVDKRTDFPDGKIAREVEGTVTVPCYLNLPGCPPGATFQLDAGGKPIRIPGNTIDARYTCRIPRSALEPGRTPAPSLYGHGLFGSRGEIHQGQLTDLGGELQHDVLRHRLDRDVVRRPAAGRHAARSGGAPGGAREALPAQLRPPGHADDPGRPVGLPQARRPRAAGDARLHVPGTGDDSKGFNSDPAFQRANGTGVIDTTRLFYDGNSQGGIIGGALAAVEPDLDRASSASRG